MRQLSALAQLVKRGGGYAQELRGHPNADQVLRSTEDYRQTCGASSWSWGQGGDKLRGNGSEWLRWLDSTSTGNLNRTACLRRPVKRWTPRGAACHAGGHGFKSRTPRCKKSLQQPLPPKPQSLAYPDAVAAQKKERVIVEKRAMTLAHKG